MIYSAALRDGRTFTYTTVKPVRAYASWLMRQIERDSDTAPDFRGMTYSRKGK